MLSPMFWRRTDPRASAWPVLFRLFADSLVNDIWAYAYDYPGATIVLM